MNQIVTRWAAVALLYSPFLPSLARSQATQKDVVTRVCGEADGDRMGYRSGAPFSASWTYTEVRRRLDGTTSAEATPLKISRDSDGKTYFKAQSWISGSIHKLGPASFWVNDPVKHISFFWSADGKQVSLLHYPAPESAENKKLELDAPWAKAIWEVPLCVAEGRQYNKEMLGTKMILGIMAEGIRATRVLPEGTMTEERWYSTALQLTLLNIVDDPRGGRGTWELTSLERAEPDPALFRLPRGYSIIDSSPTAETTAAKVTKPTFR